MSNIIELHAIKNEARIDSRLLADRLGNRHKNVIALIDQYRSDFEELGRVAFQTRPFETNDGQQKQRVALLNEDQAYLLLTYSRNTPIVRALKVELVKAFSRFRRHRQTEADYLPFYHELHDQISILAERARQAGSSTDERWFHVNFNRLINHTFGLEADRRDQIPDALRVKMTAAHVLASELLKEALACNLDHKAAFSHVKQGLAAFCNASAKRLEMARMTHQTTSSNPAPLNAAEKRNGAFKV
jgi:phage regulator Rha-like protein